MRVAQKYVQACKNTVYALQSPMRNLAKAVGSKHTRMVLSKSARGKACTGLLATLPGAGKRTQLSILSMYTHLTALGMLSTY